MSLRCAFHLHRWGPWSRPQESQVSKSVEHLGTTRFPLGATLSWTHVWQERLCERCGEAERRDVV